MSTWAQLLADEDLRCCYNGVDGANDATGNYNGTWSGTPAYTDSPAGYGQAFQFDQTNYIDAGALVAPYPDGEDFTAMCWLRMNTNTGNQYFFGQHSAYQVGWCMINLGGDPGAFVGNNAASFFSALTTVPGTWYHIAFRYNSTTRRTSFFVDGVFQEEGPIATETQGGTLQIGAGAGTDLDGDVADARVYSRALTADDIAVIAAGAPAPADIGSNNATPIARVLTRSLSEPLIR